jgi:hypothetical protein
MADLNNLTNTLRTASASLQNYAKAQGTNPGFFKEGRVTGIEISGLVQQISHLDDTISSVDRGLYNRVVPELKTS